MTDNIMPVEGNNPNEQAARREMVGKWIETGFDENAVAVFGTSIETFQRMVRSGKVASYTDPRFMPPEDLYTEVLEASDQGKKNLYLFSPILERVSVSNSSLGQEIIESYPSEDQARELLSVTNAIETSLTYAGEKVMDDYLRDMELEDLDRYNVRVALANQDDSKGQSRYFDDLLDSYREKFKDPASRRRAEEALERKGVLIFYNRKIFDNTTITVGKYEHEIIVVSDQPLEFDTISGIQVQTGKEKEEVLSAI